MFRRSAALLAVLFTLALVLAGCSSSGSGGTAAKPSDLSDNGGTGTYAGFGLTPPEPRPSFTLLDESDKPFAFGQRTAGHPTLLFFGYTHCPDECPETMADVALALKAVPATVASRSYVVFVSTDVKHDTGPVMRQWLAQFAKGSKATFVGLHGTQTQVNAAQAAAHITLATDGGETHSTQLLLYGTDDYARVSFLRSNTEQKQIAHDLPLVAQT